MYHLNKTRKRYKQQYKGKHAGCPFCPPRIDDQVIVGFDNFIIVRNNVEYDLWEGHQVVDHLLLVPKKHVGKLSDLTNGERAEMMQVISDYESRGYNIYARGVKSPRRSVEHQHTHLIKITDRRARLMLFVEKPYFLFKV